MVDAPQLGSLPAFFSRIPRILSSEAMKTDTSSLTKSSVSPDSPRRLCCLKTDFIYGLGHFVSSSDLVAEAGDLIQIDRVLYTDWVLYIGDSNVVHLCHSDNDANDSARVRISALADVAGFSYVRVNNKVVGAKERNLDALSVEQAIENAKDLVDKTVEFNMLTRNSEHYVTDWKYGSGWSDQAAVSRNVIRTIGEDSSMGHNFLVSGLQAVLNSPGSPVSRSPPRFYHPAVNCCEDSSTQT